MRITHPSCKLDLLVFYTFIVGDGEVADGMYSLSRQILNGKSPLTCYQGKQNSD
jgi:hypothetical protein